MMARLTQMVLKMGLPQESSMLEVEGTSAMQRSGVVATYSSVTRTPNWLLKIAIRVWDSFASDILE
eukprot:CAMPEP_0182518300 /NCGR_PEP_ID=MMETSP1321-20130603/44009_1 /TAXON_ID=91990 /ORGANISM="Bolidomonas sp., Strain RCC1657" /LENGTH=65 /DNA_ID=CAMNT_0024726171 /DNA_START=302 /DNA_END=499 /DNA_ORIENTATION=+